MKLSMWNIYDELKLYDPIASIKEGLPTIDDVRIFSYEENLSPDYLYIGSARDFFGKNDSNDVMLVHRHDYLIVRDIDYSFLLNSIIRILSKYRTFERELLAGSSTENPYQSMLDVAHVLFQCPMFFGRKDIRIFAITQQYTDKDIFSGWSDMKSTRTFPISLLDWIKSKNIANSYPENGEGITPMPPICGTYSCTVRDCLYINGEKWGHLYLFYKDGWPSKGILQLVNFVAETLISEVKKNKYTEIQLMSRLPALNDMLSGKTISGSDLSALYSINDWNDSTPLLLFKLRNADLSYNSNMLTWLGIALESLLSDCLSTVVDQSVILIACCRKKSAEELKQKVVNFCRTRDYIFGTSFVYSGLEHTRSFYVQASEALRYAVEKQLPNADISDCIFPSMIKQLKTCPDITNWIYPGLKKLQEVDSRHDTAYYETLCCYLQEHCHIANTARRLYIHRNTLLYRLEKIEEILGIDLADNGIRLYLILCCELMHSAQRG